MNILQWNLIIVRKEHGITQEKLAEVLGISEDAYGLKERGKVQFKADEMFIISDYFDKTIEDIFLPVNFGKTEKLR